MHLAACNTNIEYCEHYFGVGNDDDDGAGDDDVQMAEAMNANTSSSPTSGDHSAK